MVTDMRGADVFDELQRAAGAARRESDAAVAAARAVRNQVDALGRERLQTLRELAAAQLPELNAATAGGAMPELVDELQQFERERQARSAELSAQLEALGRTMAERSAQLAAKTAELDQVVARRDALLAEVAKRLAADPRHPPLAEQATQAEVRLARDVGRADELRGEAAAKLPPYEKSRLFQYLWRRQFGTAAYAARGFTARMDRWVADLIGYAGAVDGYRFLKTTPEIVRLEVERRTAEVKGLRQQLAAMEDAVEAEVGLPAVQKEVDRLVAEREQSLAAIAGVQQQIAGVHAAVREETGSRGTFHAQALQRLTAFLERAEAGALERHARATPDPRDDRLVAALRACTGELTRVSAEAGPLEQEAQRRDAIADGLEALLVRFRRAEYDAGRSEFLDLDLDRLLREARTGGLPAEDFWRALASRQRFRPPPLAHHTTRSSDVLQGVGLALQVAGVLANVAIGSSRRSGGGSWGGGFGSASSGAGLGGSGGFSTGRRF